MIIRCPNCLHTVVENVSPEYIEGLTVECDKCNFTIVEGIKSKSIYGWIRG
jgi:DNA-directed RNA polymerase subunit RPC12/RpoP